MFIILAAIATFINFAIIIWKFGAERYTDATLDLTIFIGICFLFSGTITGLQIGMIASMLVSFYLLASPPKLNI